MVYGINEVAVIVTVILAVAIGSVWYSPLLFGKYWMRAVGRSVEEVEEMEGTMPRQFVFAALGNLIALTALAVLLMFVKNTGVAVAPFSVWLALLTGGLIIAASFFEQRSLSYMAITVGYVAVIIIGSTQIVTLWPW